MTPDRVHDRVTGRTLEPAVPEPLHVQAPLASPVSSPARRHHPALAGVVTLVVAVALAAAVAPPASAEGVDRLAGRDRWITAVRISQATFDPGVDQAWVARDASRSGAWSPSSSTGPTTTPRWTLDNTSAFNCRAVTGGSSFSRHAYGAGHRHQPAREPLRLGLDGPATGGPQLARPVRRAPRDAAGRFRGGPGVHQSRLPLGR